MLRCDPTPAEILDKKALIGSNRTLTVCFQCVLTCDFSQNRLLQSDFITISVFLIHVPYNFLCCFVITLFVDVITVFPMLVIVYNMIIKKHN